MQVTQVATGSTCSFAITEEGQGYAWGFGENHQLGTGQDTVRHVLFCCVPCVVGVYRVLCVSGVMCVVCYACRVLCVSCVMCVLVVSDLLISW